MSAALPPGYQLAWHDVLDSTNEEAKRQAGMGARGPLWIGALRQAQGRGRHGRVWESLSDNLAASLLIEPHQPAAIAAQLSFVAALAVADLVDEALPGAARLKWPNDVLIRHRKVAGILLETAAAPADQNLPWLVMGIGVNLARFPAGVETPATSLAAEGAGHFSPPAALAILAARLDHHLAVWRRSGFAPIREEWLARTFQLNEPIKLRLPQGIQRGVYRGLGEDGALLLERAGQIERLHAGEVIL